MSVLSLPVVSQSASWCPSFGTLRIALFLKKRLDVSFLEDVLCKQATFECFGEFGGDVQYVSIHSVFIGDDCLLTPPTKL